MGRVGKKAGIRYFHPIPPVSGQYSIFDIFTARERAVFNVRYSITSGNAISLILAPQVRMTNSNLQMAKSPLGLFCYFAL